MCFKVEAMRTFRLILKFRFSMDLKNIFYVPSFSKIFISISKYYNISYGFSFNWNIFSILKNKIYIGDRTLINGLYKIDLDLTFKLNYLSMHVNSSIKRSKIDENPSMLWYKRLGHISIKRIKRF
jgi:hypothetical protein